MAVSLVHEAYGRAHGDRSDCHVGALRGGRAARRRRAAGALWVTESGMSNHANLRRMMRSHAGGGAGLRSTFPGNGLEVAEKFPGAPAGSRTWTCGSGDLLLSRRKHEPAPAHYSR